MKRYAYYGKDLNTRQPGSRYRELGPSFQQRLNTIATGSSSTLLVLPDEIVGIQNIVLNTKKQNLVISSFPGKHCASSLRLSCVSTGTATSTVVTTASGTSISTLNPPPTYQSGTRLLLKYFLAGNDGHDDLNRGAKETSSGGGVRRIYHEIVTVTSTSSSGVNIARPLPRQFDGTSTINPFDIDALKIFDIENTVSTNLSIKNITFTLPIILWPNQFGDAPLERYGSGLFAQQVDGLTIENVSAINCFSQGIMANICRDVNISGGSVKFHQHSGLYGMSGAMYGILVQSVNTCTVKNVIGEVVRYVVSVTGASSDVLVENISGRTVIAATADIHGGDCKNITFRNFAICQKPITIGNLAWRRGAQNVTVENITCGGPELSFAVIGSARNVTFDGIRGDRFVVFSTAPDIGNGFNNDTGAGTGYPDNCTIQNSVFDNEAEAFPLNFTSPNTNIHARFNNINFDSCSFIQNSVPSQDGILRQNRIMVQNTTNVATFTECDFVQKADISTALVRAITYSGGLPENVGPSTYEFYDCNFTTKSKSRLLMESSGETTFKFENDCRYANGGRPFTINCTEIDDAMFSEPLDPYFRLAENATCS